MQNDPIHILIVSPSGRLSNSLRVLIKSHVPEAQIEDFSTPEFASQFLLHYPHSLVLVDMELPFASDTQLPDNEKYQYILLAHTLVQLKQARHAGFKTLLLDGFSPDELYSLIK